MVLGSALMAVLGGRINLVLLYFLSIFVGASALVGTGLAPAFILALGALTIEGAATGIDNVATDTILQERVPDAFLGRVFSIRFLGYSVGEALAYPAGGLLVDAVGSRSTYIFAGIATAAAGLLALLAMFAIPMRSKEQAD
jgi:DHA3 family macrolide efflux protein-like MFS transporter